MAKLMAGPIGTKLCAHICRWIWEWTQVEKHWPCETPGHGEHETPGHGEHETPGHGEHETPGHGEHETPGHGEHEIPGHGEHETPGHGEHETPGHGEHFNPGLIRGNIWGFGMVNVSSKVWLWSAEFFYIFFIKLKCTNRYNYAATIPGKAG